MSDENESFPCIICGKTLRRAFSAVDQPSEGVMCITNGNYGSTVYDPMSNTRESLAFNICDPCLVTAAKKGRVMRRLRVPVPEEVTFQSWPDWE
jgi:hypothetical protein